MLPCVFCALSQYEKRNLKNALAKIRRFNAEDTLSIQAGTVSKSLNNMRREIEPTSKSADVVSFVHCHNMRREI
jgi:hypothetical protein